MIQSYDTGTKHVNHLTAKDVSSYCSSRHWILPHIPLSGSQCSLGQWLSRHFPGQGISMIVWTSNFPLFSINFQLRFLDAQADIEFPAIIHCHRLDASMLTMNRNVCIINLSILFVVILLMILLPWIKVWRTHTRRGILGEIMFLPGHSPITLDMVTMVYSITIHLGLSLD